MKNSRTLIPVFIVLALSAPLLTKALRTPQDASSSGTVPAFKNSIASFQYFSGTWGCQGSFPATGKTIASELTFAPALDGAFLSLQHDDLPPNKFHALEMWGWDAKNSTFSATIFDNSGGARHFTSSGWQDQSLTWNADIAPVATAPAERFVFRKDSGTQMTVNWEVNRDSSWKVGDTLTCTHK
jgi:hypothetical protein